jgi:hypothetical protein
MSAFGQTVSFGTVTGVADNAALLSTKRLLVSFAFIALVIITCLPSVCWCVVHII